MTTKQRMLVLGLLVVVVLGVWMGTERLRAHSRTEAEMEARTRAEELVRRHGADSVATDRAELLNLVHFDFDQSIVRPSDAAVLDRKLPILSTSPALRLRIAGHCDERGSRAYNRALGRRRAEAAKRYLVARGIDPARIETVSYGKTQPIDHSHTEAAWAANRRDEFEIVTGDVVAPPR